VMFHCRVTYRPPFVRIPRQINSIHCLLSYSFKFHCRVIILLPLGLPHESPVIFSLISITECYLVSTTNDEVLRHAVFANVPLRPPS
jgi:hypothetical protein